MYEQNQIFYSGYIIGAVTFIAGIAGILFGLILLLSGFNENIGTSIKVFGVSSVLLVMSLHVIDAAAKVRHQILFD
jgi:hypothetical protein